MKNKSKQIIFCFYIYVTLFLIHNINCEEEEDKNTQKGSKCVFIFNKGSEIINFHKFTGGKYKFNSNITDDEKSNWSINLCNDTQYKIYLNNNNLYQIGFNSQVVYTNDTYNYLLTGTFLKKNNDSEIIYVKNIDNSSYKIKAPFGEYCNIEKNDNFTTYILFKNYSVADKEFAEIYKLPITSTEDINCESKTLELYFDIEYAKDYLILQKVLNEGYIIIGIIFISLGIYLCFLSFKSLLITKIIICLIFGQIIIFCFEIIFIGNSTALKGYLYILIIIIGIIISCPLIYFSFINDKLYLFLLAFSSGFVNGIFVFDICFIGTNCSLTIDILIDVVLIFTISFIALMKILPKNHIYYPPVIGSYILVRGISLIIYNASESVGYIDLQLLLYLINLYENELVERYLNEDFVHFWIYAIFIGLILILTEIFNYLVNKTNQETLIEDEEEDEENITELSGTSLNINDSGRKENDI